MNRARCLYLTGFLLTAFACAGQEAPGPSPSGTLFVRFGLRQDTGSGLDFLAPTTRASLIDSVRRELRLPVDQRHTHFHGWIDPAPLGQNLDWPWAVEPDTWVLADVSYELCDGLPSQVQGRHEMCPWVSYVKDTTWVRPN
jgi:hypothetical protein